MVGLSKQAVNDLLRELERNVLRPLVLLDGTLAPQLRDFNLMAPHRYAAVKDPVVARKLLKAIHPAL